MDYLIELELEQIKEELSLINEKLEEITNILIKFNNKLSEIENKSLIMNEYNPTNKLNNPTNPQQISSFPAHNSVFDGLKPIKLEISTGNEGVPTDKQTDRQTDEKGINNTAEPQKEQIIAPLITTLHTTKEEILNNEKRPLFQRGHATTIDEAVNILNSLDSFKKELRLKIKHLTEQEFLVLSTIYQLEEEIGFSNYKLISEKLNLTESSIRDYVSRLINKGIPVDKTKVNNKLINLNLSPNFIKIASLSTILQLRAL